MKPVRAKIQKRDNRSLVQFVSTSNEIVRFRGGIHSDSSQSSPVISYPKGREKNLGRTRSLESADQPVRQMQSTQAALAQSSSTSTAILEFFSTPAGTRIVSPRFFERLARIRRLNPLHDAGRCTIRSQLSCHETHVWVHIAEEHLVTGAKVVQARFAVRRSEKPVLGALTIASKANVALTAVSRQRRFLRFTETALLVGFNECLQW